MEKSHDGNGKNKSSTNAYTNKNIIKLNGLISAGAKLVCEKIRIPLKSTKKNQNLHVKFDWKRRYESYENKQKWKNKGKKHEPVGTKRKKKHKK